MVVRSFPLAEMIGFYLVMGWLITFAKIRLEQISGDFKRPTWVPFLWVMAWPLMLVIWWVACGMDMLGYNGGGKQGDDNCVE